MTNFDSNPNLLQRPIFILGVGRSGTTLLQTLLDSHPELLNIPAELHYYLDWKFLTDLHGSRPHIRQLNEYFINNTDIGYFGEFVPVGAGAPYNTTKINKEIFTNYLDKCSLTYPNSRQYLQILVKALIRSNKKLRSNSDNFKYFVCCMNVFFIEDILKDFPDAKIIIMDRDKTEVYVSQRKFWLRNFGSYYIRSYRQFPNYHFRKPYVLEMIIEYILKGVDSKNRYKGHKNVMIVDLHRLTKEPKKTLLKVAEWLDIKFTSILNRQTMCGEPYDGNLTSGDNSQAKIMNIHRIISRKDLARIEFWCLKQIIPEEIKSDNIDSDITAYKYNCLTLIVESIKLLPFESTISSKIGLLQWIRSYLMNRVIIYRYLFKRTTKSLFYKANNAS